MLPLRVHRWVREGWMESTRSLDVSLFRLDRIHIRRGEGQT